MPYSKSYNMAEAMAELIVASSAASIARELPGYSDAVKMLREVADARLVSAARIVVCLDDMRKDAKQAINDTRKALSASSESNTLTTE